MLKHAIAYEGCTDTVRESALKVDSGRKITRCTGEPNLPQRRAGSTLYQLSYIPVCFYADRPEGGGGGAAGLTYEGSLSLRVSLQ